MLTRPIAIAVLLALAVPARADEPPESADLVAGQPAPADGPWLRKDVAEATFVRCRALELQLADAQRKSEEIELRLLEKPAEPPSTPVAVVVAGGLGFVAGLLAGGWLVLKATR